MATAIVTAGAGARGAYEAGVLSVVLPRLRELYPNEEVVLLGTSAGAINTAIIAGSANTSSAAIAAKLKQTWSTLDVGQVFRVNYPAFVDYAAEFVGLCRKAYSLLDTGPLRTKVADPTIVRWDGLADILRESPWLKLTGVVATEVSTSHSVVFVQGTAPGLPLPDKVSPRGIQYRTAVLKPEHVLASSAIPIAFPAVKVDGDWYVDGGVRLNTPISPAIDILTKLFPGQPHRMIIVSTDPDPSASLSKTMSLSQPDVIDEAASLLHSMLVDRVAEDVRSLRRVNAAIGAGVAPRAPGTLVRASPQTTVSDDRRPGATFEVIEHCYFGPAERGTISDIAKKVFDEKFRHRLLPLSVFKTLSRLLGGSGASHDEILSFLFFDATYLQQLFEQGQRDAHGGIDGHDDLPWHTLNGRRPPPGPPGGALEVTQHA